MSIKELTRAGLHRSIFRCRKCPGALGKRRLMCHTSYVTAYVLHQTWTAIPHHVSTQISSDTYALTSHACHLDVSANSTANSALHLLHSNTHISENLLTYKFCTNFFICIECHSIVGNAPASSLGVLEFSYRPWAHELKCFYSYVQFVQAFWRTAHQNR